MSDNPDPTPPVADLFPPVARKVAYVAIGIANAVQAVDPSLMGSPGTKVIAILTLLGFATATAYAPKKGA